MAKLDFSKWQFLVIDDFGNYRLMMKCILSDIGVRYINDVSDGEKAVSAIRNNEYDVILCDYNLGGGKDGQQVLEEVKHYNLIKYSTIFIMITAENTMDMVMAVVEYRPDDYLTKPFIKEVLTRRLEKIVAKKGILREINFLQDDGEFLKVIDLCDEKLTAYPKLALDIAKIKGDACLKAGKIGLATKVYNYALKIRDFPWARHGLAQAAALRGDYDEAKDILKRLLKDHRSHIEAYDLLTEIHEKSGDNRSAQMVLMNATQLSPKVITRQKALGALAVKNNDLDVAEQALKATVKLGRYSSLIEHHDHINLAKVYVQQNKPDEALGVMKNCRKEFYKNKVGVLHTQIMDGSIYKDKGDMAKANEAFEIAKKGFSMFAGDLPKELQIDMADTCNKFGEKRLLSGLLNSIEETSARLDSIRDELALEKKSRTEEDYLMMNKAGMTLYRKRKLEQAMKMFEEAAYGLPGHVSVIMNAAQASLEFLAQSGFDEYILKQVRDYLDHAKDIDPNNDKYVKLEKLYQSFIE